MGEWLIKRCHIFSWWCARRSVPGIEGTIVEDMCARGGSIHWRRRDLLPFTHRNSRRPPAVPARGRLCALDVESPSGAGVRSGLALTYPSMPQGAAQGSRFHQAPTCLMILLLPCDHFHNARNLDHLALKEGPHHCSKERLAHSAGRRPQDEVGHDAQPLCYREGCPIAIALSGEAENPSRRKASNENIPVLQADQAVRTVAKE